MSKDLAKDVEQGGGEWLWCRNGMPAAGPRETGQARALNEGELREAVAEVAKPKEARWGESTVGRVVGAPTVGNWLGAREQLTHAIADLTREAERGMAVLRDSLPAVLSPAADRALARLVSDAEHVRRGRR